MNKQMTNPDKINKNELADILKNPSMRMRLAQADPYWFFHLYFSDYIKCDTAPFQKQLFKDVANESIRQLVVVSFRGSAKSTIVTMLYPMWAVIGSPQKKFIVIASQTQTQAQQHLRNIRSEIEANPIFRQDFGPLEDASEEWGAGAISIPKFNAKIIAVSRGQSIRGLRHRASRPDLVICDDIEDSESVKTAESRRDTDNWFNSEIKGVGDLNTKFVIVGNLLHEDSLVMRLKQSILARRSPREKYSQYPIVENGRPTWPGLYPDRETIELRKTDFKFTTWMREFMLVIIPEEDQVITLEKIKRYSHIPDRLRNQSEHRYVGVDLAISAKDSADYTALVSLVVRDLGKPTMKIYTLPNPTNERISFASTISKLDAMREQQPGTTFIIESVGYQEAAVQVMKEKGAKVTSIKPTTDKLSRLNIIAAKIEQGVLVFPEHGCELLISQLTGFGVEKHDDLMDALTIAIIEICSLTAKKPSTVKWSGSRKTNSSRASQGSVVQAITQNGNVITFDDPYGW